jgi:hypothetical protein
MSGTEITVRVLKFSFNLTVSYPNVYKVRAQTAQVEEDGGANETRAFLSAI